MILVILCDANGGTEVDNDKRIYEYITVKRIAIGNEIHMHTMHQEIDFTRDFFICFYRYIQFNSVNLRLRKFLSIKMYDVSFLCDL